MLNMWGDWYKRMEKDKPPYGDDLKTCQMAGEFLGDMKTVEDWGCGLGIFKRFCKGKYIGIDGTNTPAVDKWVDLSFYKSSVDGIMMRHVLEHNYGWKTVLDNAISSFNKKMCLVIFTPFSEKTHKIAQTTYKKLDVPDISFRQEDIEKRLKDCQWEEITIKTDRCYKLEHIYFITKDKK